MFSEASNALRHPNLWYNGTCEAQSFCFFPKHALSGMSCHLEPASLSRTPRIRRPRRQKASSHARSGLALPPTHAIISFLRAWAPLDLGSLIGVSLFPTQQFPLGSKDFYPSRPSSSVAQSCQTVLNNANDHHEHMLACLHVLSLRLGVPSNHTISTNERSDMVVLICAARTSLQVDMPPCLHTSVAFPSSYDANPSARPTQFLQIFSLSARLAPLSASSAYHCKHSQALYTRIAYHGGEPC